MKSQYLLLISVYLLLPQTNYCMYQQYIDMGKQLFNEGHLTHAHRPLKQALSLACDSNENATAQIYLSALHTSLLMQAHNAFELNNIAQAQNAVTHSLEAATQEHEINAAHNFLHKLFTTLITRGQQALAHGDAHKSLELFTNAQIAVKDILPYDYYNSFLHLGKAHEALRQINPHNIQLAEAECCYRTAAQNGFKEAQFHLSCYLIQNYSYNISQHTPQNPSAQFVEAERYLQLIIKDSNPDYSMKIMAYNNLGILYLKCNNIPEAKKYLTYAIKAGHHVSMHAYAEIALQENDIQCALSLLTKAAPHFKRSEELLQSLYQQHQIQAQMQQPQETYQERNSHKRAHADINNAHNKIAKIE